MHVNAQSFHASALTGENIDSPTSLDFGPNGKLYVAQQDGAIWEFTVARDGAVPGSGSYSATGSTAINMIKTGIPNHNDDGTLSTLNARQVTGLLATGTSSVPVLYVTSSDSRIGGGSSGTETNLDTNSGVLSRLTWTGGNWDRVDLVRGLPRCEENHSTNGMDIFQSAGQTYLLIQQGGNTNKGAPSNNFAGTAETYLSAALLIVNLTQLEQMESANGGPYLDTRQGSTKYIYDLPTLNDPDRADIDNSDPNFPYPSGHPMFNATIDLGDPFGGNNGLNQAFSEPGGPVQIFSPGYRNAYDVAVTANGRIYSVDNGPNSTWGGLPVIYTSSNTVKGDESTTTYDPGAGDYITNDLNESGSTGHSDPLHYVGTISDPNGTYYAGHPDPTRAFPSQAGVINHVFDGSNWIVVSSHNFGDLLAGSSGYFNPNFTIANFPDDSRQGEYLADESTSSTKVNILDRVNSSTNGICEYTASNFAGAMQGDLLTASFNGSINRYQLNPSGTASVSTNHSFLSGFGGIPLDVIAQGDSDPFSGTIWAVTYGASNITVFEPVETGSCLQPGDGGYLASADYDSDGYTNGDEVDNGKDHCNGGDKPNDNDGDFLSDLNDPDDDNDGILDVNDAFAWDADNGTTTNLPINYPFWNNDPATGFFGLGFTGWMTNGATDYLNQYDETNLSFGGAAGKATVDSVDNGDAYSTTNSQNNGFQFGINVDINSAPFTIHAGIETPFSGIAPVNYQSYGIFIGNGDQDNYLKVVIMDGVTDGDGLDGFEVLLENGGNPTSFKYDVVGLLQATSVEIYIGVNPSANTAQPYYSLDGGNTVMPLGVTAINLPLSWLASNSIDDKGLAVGLISTSAGTGPEFTATWDFINITEDTPANLSVLPNPIDFGSLAPNSGMAQLNVAVQNSGSPSQGALQITDIAITGTNAALFSNTSTLPIQIGPGSAKNVAVNFTPDSNIGFKTANMVITHTGANSPLTVPLAAVLDDFDLRINSGGPAITYGAKGFQVDGFFTGGNAFTNSNAQVPTLYQTERNSPAKTFDYNIPVTNGNYTVILHFAEIYWGATGGGAGGIGKRIFDVSIEGSLVLDNYDINADVGPETVVAKSFIANVTDALLNINFSALAGDGGVDQPKISAIEIIGGTLGVDKLSPKRLDILFFPNPTSSETQIRISDPSLELSYIYINDISGRLIKKFDAPKLKLERGLYKLDVSGLTEGIYLVNLRANGTTIFGHKLIIKK